MGGGAVTLDATSLSVKAPQGEVADVTGLANPTAGTRDLVATGDVRASGEIVIQANKRSGSASWNNDVGKSGTLTLVDPNGNIPGQSWNVFLVSVEDQYNTGGLAVESLTFQTED
jgi:hypothetical protein